MLSAFSPQRFSNRLAALIFIALCCHLAIGQANNLTNGEDDPIKLFEQGQDAHAKNDYRKAIELYDAALKLKPEFPEAELQRALALIAINQKSEALDGFKRAVTLRPDWPLAYSQFGIFLSSYGNDPVTAEPILRRAIALDSNDAPALAALAELRARAGDLSEGVKLIRSATSLPSATASTWRKRAFIEAMAKEMASALKSLDQALLIDPRNVGARYDRAKLRIEAGDHAGAFADLQVLEQAGYASDLQGAVELAQFYARAGKAVEAIRILDGLKETDRKRPEVIVLRSEIADTGNLSPEELQALEQLLARDPRNASLLARLGSAYRRVDPAKSLTYFAAALKLEPKNAKYGIGYAAALNQLRRFAEAEAVLRAVLTAAPDEYTAHSNLALALYEQKRFAEALPEYEWLASVRPEIAATYFFIAVAHDNLGAYQQALAAYQKFLERADSINNKLEIEKVNLRLPSLRAQIQRGQGVKPKKP